jgi:hypothetical protein
LAAAEELEENTTYTNADGVDCLIPAIRSSAYLDSAPHLGNGSAGPASTLSSSSNLAGQDSSESARFIERCVSLWSGGCVVVLTQCYQGASENSY